MKTLKIRSFLDVRDPRNLLCWTVHLNCSKLLECKKHVLSPPFEAFKLRIEISNESRFTKFSAIRFKITLTLNANFNKNTFLFHPQIVRALARDELYLPKSGRKNESKRSTNGPEQ